MCSFYKVSSAHRLPSVQSGQRRAKDKVTISTARLLIPTPASPANVEFLLSLFSPEGGKKQNEKKKFFQKNKLKWLSLAARHCISCSWSWNWRGFKGHWGGESALTSLSLKTVFSVYYQWMLLFPFEHIVGPWVSATSIHIFIIMWNRVCLICWRFFFVFLLLVRVGQRQFLCRPNERRPRSPRNTWHRSAGTKGRPRGFGLNKFFGS